MRRELIVLLNAEPIGVLTEGRSGHLVFRYHESWRDRHDSYPLSLSLPLTRSEHSDEKVRPYLEGLLTDNKDLLEALARTFHVSSRNPFALLSHIGEDCAGAVQFVRPERVDGLLRGDFSHIEWLTEFQIAELLRNLVRNHGTGRAPGGQGYFSLAGAQPKTVLIYRDGRWGVPAGGVPTTHILKPPAQEGLHGFAVNEHFCLRLAQALGLPAAESEVMKFNEQVAIVVKRYDRALNADGEVERIHQEDACQALSISPYRKYEADGGPGAREIIDLLLLEASNPDRDVGLFWDALALNWVILGADAHAKNYSILINSKSIELAPLYDLISLLPYPQHDSPRRLELAMRVDREYQIWKVRARHWEELARKCGLDVEPAVKRIQQLLRAIPGAVQAVVADLQATDLEDGILETLPGQVIDRAIECLTFFDVQRSDHPASRPNRGTSSSK